MSDDSFTEESHLSRTGFDTLPEGFQGGRVAYEMSQPIPAVSPPEFDPDAYADNLTEVMAHALSEHRSGTMGDSVALGLGDPVPLFVSRAVERRIVDYCDVHGLPVPRMVVYSDLLAEIAHDPTENPRRLDGLRR